MHGLYLLFWVQEKGLSPAAVAAALAAGDLAVMVFEIPTGWVADRWGSRASLITGSLMQVVGMLACWLAPGLFSLIAGSLFIALGDAFRSGADQALLYRTCAALERPDAFRRIEARTHAVTLIALVLLVLTGGVVVQRWGFAAGWMAEALLCGFGALLAVMMVEVPNSIAQSADDEGPSTRQSWTLLVSGRLLRAVLPASLMGAAASATSFVAQTGETASAASVTGIVAVAALAEAGGSLLGAQPGRFVRPSSLLAIAAVALGVALAVPSLVAPVAVVLALLDGAAHPARASAIQGLASHDVRARAASVASACDMAISSITLPLAGALRARRRR